MSLTLPLSEATARLAELAAEVERTRGRVNLTRDGRESVVLLSAAELDSLEATIELLCDPAAQRRIAESQAAIARGEGVGAEEMAELMEARRRSGR